jgi:protein-tyrosine phosphatase
VIDLHCHVLPAVDDGAPTLAAALEIARAAAAAGTTVLAATPHVRDDYPTTAEEIEQRLAELGAAVGEAGIPLQVVQGAEIALDYLPLLGDEELRRMSLAGRGRHLLIETPYYGWPAGIEEVFFSLALRGYTPILGHPERNGVVQLDPAVIRPLVEGGALVQLTAASVSGHLGRRPRRVTQALIRDGLAHIVASDAHSPTGRDLDLLAACSGLGDSRLSHWLCNEVGAAIVAGERPPERPPGRRRWMGRRRGRGSSAA